MVEQDRLTDYQTEVLRDLRAGRRVVCPIIDMRAEELDGLEKMGLVSNTRNDQDYMPMLTTSGRAYAAEVLCR